MGDTASGKSPVIHWAWIILFISFINLFVNYGIRLGYSVVLPEMIRTLGFSRRQAGDIFNAYFLTYILLSLFAGNLTDRLGARKIIPMFGVVLGIGTLLMGTSASFWQASMFFGIVGMGAAAMWTPIIALVQRWFAVKRRGMALGILSTGFGLGFASMGKLFPIIVAEWSWRYCWYFLGIAALIMVSVNLFFLRSKPEDKGLVPWGTPVGEIIPTPQATGSQAVKTRYSEILTVPRFWILGFSYLLVAGSLYIPTTFMVDYARYELGFPYERASLLATIHGIGQIIGVLSIGMISDYIGRRMTILLSNLCIGVSIVCIVASGGNQAWLFTSIGALGAFFGATFPMYGAAGGDYFRKEIMGTVIGALTIFYGTGAILAHRFAGQIRDATGSFTIPFIIAIVASILASVLMVFVKRSK
ncbi:MAG TPA: MFS transporter [Syntrophorhabdus sp.]|nr:MFS transporter [Syntrophorhabdus sp.]